MPFTRAIVRGPSENFAAGLTTAGLGTPDFARAREQHERYCETLERCGLALIRLPADERFPDGTFVEVFYMNRAACLWGGRIDVDAKGTIAVPDGPGLGYEPDRDVMARYRVQ